MADNEKNKLSQKIRKFGSNNKARNPNMRKEKASIINSATPLFKGRQMVVYAFESRMF